VEGVGVEADASPCWLLLVLEAERGVREPAGVTTLVGVPPAARARWPPARPTPARRRTFAPACASHLGRTFCTPNAYV
jgi:hypothetical protein